MSLDVVGLPSLWSSLFGCGVDDSPINPDVLARNERMIQFYVVLYGLLLAADYDFNSYFSYFLMFSVLYYILITRTVGDSDEKKYKIVFLGHQAIKLKKLTNFVALSVGFFISVPIVNFFTVDSIPFVNVFGEVNLFLIRSVLVLAFSSLILVSLCV